MIVIGWVFKGVGFEIEISEYGVYQRVCLGLIDWEQGEVKMGYSFNRSLVSVLGQFEDGMIF